MCCGACQHDEAERGSRERVMARRPISIVVVKEGERRFLETTFGDGETVRTIVETKKKPTRRPRRPEVRAQVKDFTRNKRF